MSVNSVIVVGRVGRDAETRYTQADVPVANFSIATSERWTDKRSGEKREKTTWHRISCFGALADLAGEHVRKGDLIGIEGKLEPRKWVDKNDIERETVEILASKINFFGVRGSESGGEQSDARPGSGGRRTRSAATVTDDNGFDDDIPF